MDGGSVCGTLLSVFLQVLFDRLASQEVVDFISSSKYIGDLLKMLRIELLSSYTVLDDAEAKQLTKPVVKEWLEELKHEVYHAEDLIDEIETEALRRKVGDFSQYSTSRVRRIFVRIFEKSMTTKLKEIIHRVEFIIQKKDLLSLNDNAGGCKLLQRLPSTSLVDDSGIYGRDDDKEAIMNMLISNNDTEKNISVISIVGMGGVGKTTLAQLLYNDDRVDEFFDFKAWVCVSEVFDVYHITKEVFEAFGGLENVKSVVSESIDFNGITEEVLEALGQGWGNVNSANLNDLQINLKKRVTGKKFLLVLDDVWNENYASWEALQAPLNYGAPGSKIIVTSRNKNVASVVATSPIYFLKQLTDEDCWMLFAKHAYAYGDCRQSDQEVIGRKIAAMSQVLPLAAKALGTLLRSKYAPSEWNNVLESSTCELFDKDGGIIPSLQLSYYYLPSYLKRCFAYCSIFPKNFEFKKEHLVQLWMSENLLQQTSEMKRLEDIGDEYFNDLVSMSFFQQSSGNQQNFVMHDLIHDLAKTVSGNFVTVLGEKSRPCISEKTRHVSFCDALPQSIAQINSLKKAKYLRTILQLDVTYGYQSSLFLNEITGGVYMEHLPHLSHLRVLSLHCVNELPCGICYMYHLRYLAISNSVIKEIPDSIGWCINLLVLKLFNCKKLVRLPTNLRRLVNLRHLDIRKTKLKEMPVEMGRLRHLQTLTTFVVGKGSGSSIKELGCLQQLRGALSILQLQNVLFSQEARDANLKQKKGLKELVLQWEYSADNSEKERAVLNEFQPNENLKELTIDGYGGTSFPGWLGYDSFSTLVSLRLLRCHYCFSLPPLGQLPSLRSLFICEFNQIEVVSQEFYGNCQPFKCLQVLEFRGLPMWKEWSSYINDNVVAFPCLQELAIIECYNLLGDLPSHLPSLSKLRISGCPQLAASKPLFQTIPEVIVEDI